MAFESSLFHAIIPLTLLPWVVLPEMLVSLYKSLRISSESAPQLLALVNTRAPDGGRPVVASEAWILFHSRLRLPKTLVSLFQQLYTWAVVNSSGQYDP